MRKVISTTSTKLLASFSVDQHPNLAVKTKFFEISKAFDRVSHEGLLFKLEHIGITGNPAGI